MKLRLSLVVASLVALLAVPVANADITLTDLNSTVTINTDLTSPYGQTSWIVDGVDQMFEQWFWFRIGDAGGESVMPVTSFSGSGRNGSVSYLGNGFTIDVAFLLTGGTVGSRTSDLAESIRIINTGATPLGFHFFQYVDFDLDGTAGGDRARIVNSNTAQQWSNSGSMMVNETVITPVPSHFEAGIFSATRDSLLDVNPTTLNNSAGPTAIGDATWAFQWDFALGAGDTFLISKDKKLVSAIPEPASILGLGTVLFLLGSRLRRKKA